MAISGFLIQTSNPRIWPLWKDWARVSKWIWSPSLCKNNVIFRYLKFDVILLFFPILINYVLIHAFSTMCIKMYILIHYVYTHIFIGYDIENFSIKIIAFMPWERQQHRVLCNAKKWKCFENAFYQNEVEYTVFERCAGINWIILLCYHSTTSHN